MHIDAPLADILPTPNDTCILSNFAAESSIIKGERTSLMERFKKRLRRFNLVAVACISVHTSTYRPKYDSPLTESPFCNASLGVLDASPPIVVQSCIGRTSRDRSVLLTFQQHVSSYRSDVSVTLGRNINHPICLCFAYQPF